MNKILLLIKTATKTAFSSFNHSTKYKALYIGLYIFLALYMFGFSFGISYFMMDSLSKSPQTQAIISYVPVIMLIMSSLIVFITSLFSASNTLFKAKDLSMQFSMPLSHFSILTTKFSGLYFLTLLFSAIIFIPNCITYFMFVPFDFGVLVIFILSLFISPLIPCILGTLLSVLITFTFGRFRRKNLFEIAISFIFIFLYFRFINNIQSSIEYIITNADSLFNTLSSIYFPAFLFYKSINNSIIHFLLYVAASLIPTYLLLRLLAPIYSKLVSAANQSIVKSNYRLTTQKQGTKSVAMLKKELTMFFSSTIYVLNTIIMLVLLTVGSVYVILSKDKISELLMLISSSTELNNIIFFAAVAALTTASAMSATTSPSISLEGSRIWIYKSSPVSTFDVFKAKISLSMVCCMPLIIINALLISLAFEFNILQFLLFVTTPAITLFVTSELGLIFNLLFPKMIWKNETMVVKNSASVMFSVLLSMALSTVFTILGIILLGVLNVYFIVILIIAISVLLAFLFDRWLKVKGKQKFEALIVDN